MLDFTKIKAITLDLDDTLWPVWPTIGRAEEALAQWLAVNAPKTVPLCAIPGYQRKIREEMPALRPDLGQDLSALRREAIRVLLQRADENPHLAESACEVFFAARQRVDFFADALPALKFWHARYPIVALSNGNADLKMVGIDHYFTAAFNPISLGVGKPDARMFHAGAKAAGVAPHEVLHIGDDAHLDVAAALNAGMQVAWVNRESKAWSLPDHAPPLTVQDLQALCDLWPPQAF